MEQNKDVEKYIREGESGCLIDWYDLCWAIEQINVGVGKRARKLKGKIREKQGWEIAKK